MKTVIMAGGKGTRVKSVSKEIPKSLLKLNGKPVLQHQLECLKREGLTEIILCLGYMSDSIINFLKDKDNFGMNISFVIEPKLMGTAGSLRLIPNLNSDFILIYGDIIFDIYFKKFIDYHYEKGGIASLLIHPNDHPYDSDLVQVDENGRVESFLMKNENKALYSNNVNSGLFILNTDIIKHIPRSKVDLVNDVFPKVLQSKMNLYGYPSSEYVKDMGTPSRMKEIEEFLMSEKIHSKNLRNPQPAVFLDRVINKEVDQLIDINKFELLDGVTEAIRLLNNSDYLSIVVTNQPSVAKGFCNLETIESINRFMETLLGNEGLKLDSIYFCPHHPERGFPGENKKYKIDCNCRKPKIGLFESAKSSFNIDYSKSYIVGDRTSDIMAGKNAGISSILVRTGYGGRDAAYQVNPDYTAENLKDAVSNIILNR